MTGFSRSDFAVRVLVICGVIGWLSAAAGAEQFDWPRWRGPSGDGVSKEANWQPRFGREGPKVAWRKQIGIGYGAVAVADGKAYVSGHEADSRQDVVRCFKVDTGQEVWSYRYRAERYKKLHKGGPGATPTIDGDRVYTMSKGGQLFCLNAADGKVVWQKNLQQLFSVKPREWGFSGSALVRGEHLIIDAGVIAAFDKKSGTLVWKSRDYTGAKKGGYSSPVLITLGGREMIAAFPEYGLVLLDPNNKGREIAKHQWTTKYGINSATPVVVGKDHVFISSGYNTGCALVRFDGRALKVVWENRNMKNKMASCVVVGKYLYGFDESRLRCLDPMTGDEQWTQRGTGHGALMVAGNTMVAMGEKGAFFTAQATPAGYKQISSFQLFKEGDCWIMPVLSNGRVYCRSSTGELVCFDMRK